VRDGFPFGRHKVRPEFDIPLDRINEIALVYKLKAIVLRAA
jgi:hypothetical protein